jgi:hypothetical protein
MYKIIMNLNIDKAIQSSKIEKKRHEYYKLKELQEKLPRRLKNAEVAYYEEGGCNLNDPSDTKRCGLEYYLDIKKEERIKALEGFINNNNKNDEYAEEINSYSIFDNLKLSNLFSKTVEGMVEDGKPCDWTTNQDGFKKCDNYTFSVKDEQGKATDVPHPCKYNNDLETLIDELDEYRTIKNTIGDQTKYLNKMSVLSGEASLFMDKSINEYRQKSIVDYRNASFYDKHSETYINTINILKKLYWLVLVILTIAFLYKRYYENDVFGYLVILFFIIIPIFILKPIANLIMLNVKRFHFIDTLYFTIAITTVLFAMFLYFLTSQGTIQLSIPIPDEGTKAIAKAKEMVNATEIANSPAPTNANAVADNLHEATSKPE